MEVPVVSKAEFLQSVTDWRKCPPPVMPEYAFIGRSNVGKSSLINMLVQNNKLAKTSSKPGKTQTINHFLINRLWYLVDLPGYGYATISKTMREKWVRMIRDYFMHRENLQLVFVLIDTRIEPQPADIEFIGSLGEMQIPFAIVFTKTDKLTAAKMRANCDRFENKLLETWESLPDTFVSSALNGLGRDEILSYIQHWNRQYMQLHNK